MKKATSKGKTPATVSVRDYSSLLGGVSELLESARRASARAVNALMTATYWEVGRRIVEFEQGGEKRAEYGEEVLKRLADDLTARFGRGFSRFNLGRFRQLYLAAPADQIRATLSLISSGGPIRATPSLISRQSDLGLPLSDLARAFPLPWSHYVLLISRSRSPEAFAFYQTEALRGGWSVRQLQRQMDCQFYERTALSRNKAAMLRKGAKPQPGDAVTADEEIRHPLVLEFLGLRDEYSESDLEDALIRHLETFLLELGNDFAFVGR
jgi:predicted nuclease of restriction endonuclease-like (RecB) superfamily